MEEGSDGVNAVRFFAFSRVFKKRSKNGERCVFLTRLVD